MLYADFVERAHFSFVMHLLLVKNWRWRICLSQKSFFFQR